MTWLLQDEDDRPDPSDRTIEDVAAGEKTTETHEDVFKREHDRTIEDALKVRRQREEFREAQLERIESYQARKEQRGSIRRQQLLEQAAKREEARAKETARQVERKEAEEKAKVMSLAEEKKKREKDASAKQGGDKPFAVQNQAARYIEKIRHEVHSRYSEMERGVHETEQRIKEIEKKTRDLTNQSRESRFDFGKETRKVKRELADERPATVTREVNKLREQLYKQGAAIRSQSAKLRSERASLTAQLNRDRTALKQFKRLVDKVDRVYTNRNSTLTDAFKELDQLHGELERYKIRLPNLRMSA